MSNRYDIAYRFYKDAKERNQNAAKLLHIHTANDWKLCTKPYATSGWHKDALWYPLYHTAKFVLDIGRLASGLGLFIEAYCANDKASLSLLSEGLPIQCENIILDIINGIVSTISLIARTIFSIVYGYSENTVKPFTRQELENAGLGRYLTTGLAGLMDTCAKAIAPGTLIESEISERTFRF